MRKFFLAGVLAQQVRQRRAGSLVGLLYLCTKLNQFESASWLAVEAPG